MLKKIKNIFKPERYCEGFNLKPYKDKRDMLSGFCLWSCMVDDGVILLKTGALMRSFIFYCPDLGSSSLESINAVSMYFNNALKTLGTGWSTQFEVQRYKTKDYPGAQFDNEAAFIIDKARENNFKKYGEHFASSYYLTFTKELESEIKQKSKMFFFKKDNNEDGYVNTEGIRKEIQNFIITTDKVVSSLKSKLKITPLNSQELITYIHTSTSLKWYSLNFPNHFMFIDRMITTEDLENSIPMKLGEYYIPIISITDFPQSTRPAIFDILNAAKVEYRWSTRFISLSKKEALQNIEKWIKRFYGAKKSAKQLVFEEATKIESGLENQGALSLQADAQNAQEECMTDIHGFGYYTSTLMVWDKNVERALDKARYIENLISSTGFMSIIEEANAFQAFLSMMPGNITSNVRQPLISTGNLSHIIPLSSIWEGMISNDHTKEITGQDAPLIAASTIYGTPFFFNLNVKDVGHTFIFGPTGAGKSTLLNLIEAQFKKYPESNIIILDKDKSARGITMAAGGIYVEPGSDDISFQPLRDLESTVDILWAAEFIEMLLIEQHVTVLPEMKKSIREALNLMKDKDLNSRTLTTFNQYVIYTNPQTGINDIQVGISPYIKGGQYGDIFDADSTSMPLSKWTMIEMGSLMKLSSQAVAPALMFIFKYLENIWEGKHNELTLLVMDEAWIFLQNPIFQKRIESWLLTLRKKNVFCVFATQNVASAKKSDIAEILVQQCLTKVYLADESALSPPQKEGYRFFGLQDFEIEAISHAVMKRDYYYKSPLGSRMFQLDLDNVQLALLTPDHAFLDKLEEKYGKNCEKELAKEILEHKNINYESFFK